MNVIRTPNGLIPIDDPAKVVTQSQFNELEESEKNNGTYYIIDEEGENLFDIIGNRNISEIGDNIKDAIFMLYKNSKIVSFDVTCQACINSPEYVNLNYKHGNDTNYLCELRNGRELVFKESGLYEISVDIVINNEQYCSRIIVNNTDCVTECYNNANKDGNTSLNFKAILNVNAADYCCVDICNVSGNGGSVFTDKSLIIIKRVIL